MPIFRVELTLRFGDCDPSGIAYFPAYLNLLNGVVEEFWGALGHPWTRQINERCRGTPTAHLSCNFARPSRFGDRLLFELRVVRVGKASLELAHRIVCNDEVRWTAKQVLVSTDLSTGASKPWDQDVRGALKEFMEPQHARDSSETCRRQNHRENNTQATTNNVGRDRHASQLVDKHRLLE
jgi:4-hydroxybenzoyl-CoA thioesterase